MKTSFKENQGIGIQPDRSYQVKREICNDNFVSLVGQGKAALFSLSALQKKGEMQSAHVNHTMWTEKQGSNGRGRVCLDPARPNEASSYNGQVNKEAHDALPTYGPPICPRHCHHGGQPESQVP